MFKIFQLIPYQNGDERKTAWKEVGVGFAPNRDGSINLKLHLFPGVQFQLRKEEEAKNGK